MNDTMSLEQCSALWKKTEQRPPCTCKDPRDLGQIWFGWIDGPCAMAVYCNDCGGVVVSFIHDEIVEMFKNGTFPQTKEELENFGWMRSHDQ